jgi:hypothetical protein
LSRISFNAGEALSKHAILSEMPASYSFSPQMDESGSELRLNIACTLSILILEVMNFE